MQLSWGFFQISMLWTINFANIGEIDGFTHPNAAHLRLLCANALVAGEEKKIRPKAKKMQNWSSAFDQSLRVSRDFACRRKFATSEFRWLSDKTMWRIAAVQERRMFLHGGWRSCGDTSSSSVWTQGPAGPALIAVSLLDSQVRAHKEMLHCVISLTCNAAHVAIMFSLFTTCQSGRRNLILFFFKAQGSCTSSSGAVLRFGQIVKIITMISF